MAVCVTLRPVEDSDSGRLHAWRNSPEVAAYMYTDHAISAEEHARWFTGLKGDARRAYWIIEADGAPVPLIAANMAAEIRRPFMGRSLCLVGPLLLN